MAHDGLARELMRALEALRQKNEQDKNVYVPAARSQMDALMLKHGINPTVPDDVLRDIVGGIRRGHNRRLHSDVTSDPASEARLREINSELDRILESRGLGKNQG